MEIAFFTEGQYQGRIPRNHPNMRTDLAWVCALEAEHWNINQPPNKHYDVGIVIIPKKNPQFDIKILKRYCDKIIVMQEGPNWYWQDYPLEQQIWYFNTIQESDFMFVHNKSDQKYYQGLTGKKCGILPPLMIEDEIKDLPKVNRQDVIIGGNFCSWYGGFDSYIIAQELDCSIHIPSMGRKIGGEEQMENLNHLPYMNWVEWINKLSQFKYGVHLMRTHAAGTFTLNCAFHGIPCIGYKGLDTQEELHSELTVYDGDIESAKKLVCRLRDDVEFYNDMSTLCAENYKKSLYNEKNFIPYIIDILREIYEK
jgi:hypothetical protein|tara:strand:+ start:2438 stop:3370 length:933 start_codon:yes stop_codon:yes gene_type:complete